MNIYAAPGPAQQPAAICALKTAADAIHILEAVRVGLVPRVTRRLTGHERNQIRPGTVWVWEEEETNMKRWTDGRRWGASRVGNGGFLIYAESSPSESSHHDQVNGTNDYSSHPVRETLLKQTWSTTMLHPSTGKTMKFHIVGYSSKNNPHGDGPSSLPCPAQLPLLSTLEIAPGVWPEWEKLRDGAPKETSTKKAEGGAKRGEGLLIKKKKVAAKHELASSMPSPHLSPEISTAGFASTSYPIRGPGSAPPSYAAEPRQSMSNPYESAYYYPPPPPRSAPPHQPNFHPQPQPDRYHPYRDRPGPYPPNQPPADLPTPPSSAQYYDDRRPPGSIPMSNLLPSGSSDYNPNPYSAPPQNSSHSPYMTGYYRDIPAERSPYQPQMIAYPSPYTDNAHPYYQHMDQYPNQPPSHQPRHPPARELSYSPIQTLSTPDTSHPVRSPKFNSISSALSGQAADPGRLTLPPLRVAYDRPANQGRIPPDLSTLIGGDRRELGELGKKVSL